MTGILRVLLGAAWVFLGQADASAAANRIEAMSLAPVAQDQPIEIWASGDSEVSALVETVFRQRLAEAGYQTAPEAGVVFSFTVQTDAFGQDNQRRFAIEGRGTGKRGVQGDVSIRLGLDSPDRVASRELTLRVTLGRSGDPPLWTGFASGSLSGTDRLTLGQQLAHGLMDRFGKSTALPPELLK